MGRKRIPTKIKGLLAKLIQDRRVQLGMTQSQLGERMGLHDAGVTVSKWENKKTVPTWYYFKRLSDALQLSWQKFLKVAEKESPDQVVELKVMLRDYEDEFRHRLQQEISKLHGGQLMKPPPSAALNKLETIRRTKTKAHDVTELVHAAVEFYLNYAHYPLDAKFQPILPPNPSKKGGSLGKKLLA